jgi:hypothetical protein
MSLPHPYIEWTDEIGAARLTLFSNAFQSWTPDQMDVGDSQTAVGSGLTYFFSYRTDHLAYLEIPYIANTELVLALRLKSWLVRGGQCVITTFDSEDHVYTVVMAPLGGGSSTNAAVPALTMTDSVELEYMLAMTVKNVDTPTPRPMPYTPVANSRPAALVLSPSPITIPFPGGGADVTATVTDALGHGVAGIHLSAVSSDPAAFTTVLTAVTNGSGVATFHVTPVAGGTGNLTISDGDALSTVDVVTIAAGVYGISSPAPILWLKPDTISGSAVDGLDVATWPDSSPHGWDMTVLSGSNNPKWDAAKGALRFSSASSQAYENAAFNSLQAGVAGYTLFIVSQEASNGGCVMSSLTGDYWEGYTSAGRYRTDLGGFGFNAYFTFADLLKHVHETRYDGTQSTQAARTKQLMDGTLETSTYFSIGSTLTSGPGLAIGHGTSLTHFNGWLWEVLMFGARLSDSDSDSVTTQLKTKYGL